jgi:hypothetical protein
LSLENWRPRTPRWSQLSLNQQPLVCDLYHEISHCKRHPHLDDFYKFGTEKRNQNAEFQDDSLDKMENYHDWQGRFDDEHCGNKNRLMQSLHGCQIMMQI